MAHQAILAAAERRRQTAAEAGGFLRKDKSRRRQLRKLSLQEALALERDRLDALFPIWDVDGDGDLSRKEVRGTLCSLARRPIPQPPYPRPCALQELLAA